MPETGIQNRVFNDIEPVIAGLGFELVEVKIGRGKRFTSITVIIYRSNGIRINDCTAVSKSIYPRLELFDELENIELKVTSPGIDRTFSSPREFGIFKNKGVKILLDDTGEWIGGTITELSGSGNTDNDAVSIKTGNRIVTINYRNIRKARLDYTQER